MIHAGEANLVRTCKLALIGAVAAICSAGAAFLVDHYLRQIAAGAAAGLTFTIVSALIQAYRRRGPVDASPAALEKKARRGRAATSVQAALSGAAFVLMSLLHIQWYVVGFAIGLLAFLGLLLSPLLWERPSSPADNSPRMRMTSAERAANVRYE